MIHLSRPFKYFLSLILLSLFCFNTYSQKFSLGPQLGANMSRIDGRGFDNSYKLSYHAGGYFSLNLSNKWSAQIEALWSQLKSDTAQEFRALYENLPNQNFSNPQLEYLTIPVSLTFKPGKLLSFQGGVQYAILMNHSNSLLQNGKDAFNNGDISALLGVQLHVLNFRIYGRYLMGINDIGTADLNNEWKTSVIQVGAAFAIF